VLELWVKEGKRYEIKAAPPTLLQKRGVFVTLRKNGMLRGCIGYPFPIKTIVEAVVDNTINAASEDPRFPPVQPHELTEITIEITVLGEFQPINNIKDIIIGKHGLYLENGWYSALFLPSVPVEQRWSREEYVQHLCEKAGLSRDCWRDKNTRLYVFEGEEFGED